MKKTLFLVVVIAICIAFTSCTSASFSNHSESSEKGGFVDRVPETIISNTFDEFKTKFKSDGGTSSCDETMIRIAEALNVNNFGCEPYRYSYERGIISFDSFELSGDVTLTVSWKSEEDDNAKYALTVRYDDKGYDPDMIFQNCSKHELEKLYYSQEISGVLYRYVINNKYYCQYVVKDRNSDDRLLIEQINLLYYDICQNIENVINTEV